MKIIEKVKKEELQPLTIEFTVEELHFLATIMSKISGGSKTSGRVHAYNFESLLRSKRYYYGSSIYDKLSRGGIKFFTTEEEADRSDYD
jgi:hypothetical protein